MEDYLQANEYSQLGLGQLDTSFKKPRKLSRFRILCSQKKR